MPHRYKSSKTDKITSSKVVKLKDPKRVEQGRKLASISKAAKEKKARERFELEATADRAQETGPTGDSWNIDYGFIVGVIGVAAAVGTLYLTYQKDQAADQSKTRTVDQQGKVGAPKTQASNIEMFD